MDLDDRIAVRLAAQGGVSSVTELVELGVSRHVVDRSVDAGLLVRLRRNVVAQPAVWGAAAPWERHALRARGTARAWRGAPFALSHHSALALLAVPLHGVDSRVHVARLREGGGHRGSTTQIHAAVPDAFLAQVEDICVVTASLATLQVAGTFGVEAGLVSADALLRTDPSTDFSAALAVARLGNNEPRAELTARLADGRAESAGESRTRWVMRTTGLPVPELQAWIRDGDGFAARVDFLFRQQRVVVEFDGMLKYTSEHDLRAEKLREERLRELGYEVVRLLWVDLDHPQRGRAKILAAFARASAHSA